MSFSVCIKYKKKFDIIFQRLGKEKILSKWESIWISTKYFIKVHINRNNLLLFFTWDGHQIELFSMQSKMDKNTRNLKSNFKLNKLHSYDLITWISIERKAKFIHHLMDIALSSMKNLFYWCCIKETAKSSYISCTNP